MGSKEQGLLARHTYSIQFTDGTLASSPSVAVYNRAGTAKTPVVMPSGSAIASTNVVTLPEMRNLDEDDEVYRVVVVATVDGQTVSRAFDVVPKNEQTVG